MGETNTSWTKATINPSEAMLGLVSCLEAGKNAWIELRKNGDQRFPVMKKNPELDNPFNWTLDYGEPRNEKAMESAAYFNETQKDLTYNWTACFGAQEAIDKYQKDGTVSDGLCKEIGICHPVRREDAKTYRQIVTGDNYDGKYWISHWKPKPGIKLYVVDDSISEVFTVCCDDSPMNKKEALEKAAKFLIMYAENIK